MQSNAELASLWFANAHPNKRDSEWRHAKLVVLPIPRERVGVAISSGTWDLDLVLLDF
jgi:hypothetical protein